MSELSSAPARLEMALTDLEKPLVTLASAGVLLGVGLTFRDGEESCGAAIFLDHDDVGEADEADFSALRLLVGPDATASLEIICQDNALGRKLVDHLLPRLAAETLAVTQIRWQAEAPEVDLLAEDALEEVKEETDEYDDDDHGWR